MSESVTLEQRLENLRAQRRQQVESLQNAQQVARQAEANIHILDGAIGVVQELIKESAELDRPAE